MTSGIVQTTTAAGAAAIAFVANAASAGITAIAAIAAAAVILLMSPTLMLKLQSGCC